jgi:hypothetical protein
MADWTEIQDQLGCGPGQTVSGMCQALSQRLTELRAPKGSSAVYAHKALMEAAQDLAWWIQGGNDLPDTSADANFAATHAGEFGYQAEEVACVILTGSKGSPTAPADISVLITNLASAEQCALLSDHKWNEGGFGVWGSCYGLGAVIFVARRTAAPGPNP